MAVTREYVVRRAERRFRTPATLEEAESIRLDLIDRLNNVNAQLGNRNVTTPNGDRVGSDAYWEWRNRAATAKRLIEGELRHINLWLKQQRRARTADQARDLGYDPGDPASLLLAAANVYQRLRSDGVEMDPEEVAVFDAIKDFLQHGPPSRGVPSSAPTGADTTEER